MRAKPGHLVRQERTVVEKQALRAPAVASTVGDASEQRSGGERHTLMQQIAVPNRWSLSSLTNAAKPVIHRASRAVPRGCDRATERGRQPVHAAAVGPPAARFGQHGHRRTRTGGDGADVRQVPDHVADPGQWLAHSDGRPRREARRGQNAVTQGSSPNRCPLQAPPRRDSRRSDRN